MAHLTYVGDADRYYPDLGLTPTPGEVYDLDDPADGRWAAADGGVPATDEHDHDEPQPQDARPAQNVMGVRR